MKLYKTNVLQDCLKSFAFRNKYDMLANDAARKILERVKSNSGGELHDGNIWVEIDRQKIVNPTFENFDINASTQNNNIYISVVLNDDFSNKDYQRFNFVIYEVLRHELEHLDRYVMGKRPDEKYVQIYNDLRTSHPIEEHIEMVAQYIISDTEIDSYIKSIMYVAKKQNRSVLEIIEQVLKRAFFGNNNVLMQESAKNPKIVLILNNVRSILRNKLKEYYPALKEKWL